MSHDPATTPRPHPALPQPRTLVIACGALARELLAITHQHGLHDVVVECLPAALHNRPAEIPDAVRARIRRARAVAPDAVTSPDDVTSPGAMTSPGERDATSDPDHDLRAVGTRRADPVEDATWSPAGAPFDRIFVAYADCGTGGLLDVVCAEEGVDRLPGAHCYEFFATAAGFARLQDHELGSFYLTDFLVRHFDRLVWAGLGLDRHPDLRPLYFDNYTRLVYLAQTDDPALVTAAADAARRLGLELVVERTGYGELASEIVAVSVGGGRHPTPTIDPAVFDHRHAPHR